MSAILNFSNLEFVSRDLDLYRHDILLPYAKFHWNRRIRCCVMAKNDFKWRQSAVLNFSNFRIWSCDCHQVPNVQFCVPNVRSGVYRW